jgi:hypothetical protein
VENRSEEQSNESEHAGELIRVKDPLTCIKGRHEFAYASALEAKCKKCPVGYILPEGSEIKDGHIYIKDELVI